jgi:hypothetical protein
MKQLMVLGLLSFVVLVSGCVQSQFIKSIAVEKDASGKVLRVTETETAIQPGQGWPIEFENLKNIQSRNGKQKPESGHSGN